MARKKSDFLFELGGMVTPNEQQKKALPLVITHGCAYNHCAFCPCYKGREFSARSLEEVIEDIKKVKNLCSGIIEIETENFSEHLSLVSAWIRGGCKYIFLQDADPLCAGVELIKEVLRCLRQTFPEIIGVSCYARARTIFKMSKKDILDLRNLGLNKIYVGLESGDDKILKSIKKGINSKQFIEALIKAKESNLEISLCIMPGIGGVENSEANAKGTAEVINAIGPHWVMVRPFSPVVGTELSERISVGKFTTLSEREKIMEIKALVEQIKVKTTICFDLGSNPRYGKYYVFDRNLEGYKLPREKNKIIERALLTLRLDWSEVEELPFYL